MMPFLLWHLLAESARRQPQRIALRDRGESLTYDALDQQSDRLAGLLRARGIGAGDRVGVYLHKSIRAVIAICGVLKAGAAYVPLDVKSPPGRVGLMVEDCQLAGLVGESGLLSRLLPQLRHPPALLLWVDDDAPLLPPGVQGIEWSAALAGPAVDPWTAQGIESDLAYILYTSGSTGRPKGVAISHRAALSFVHWAVDYFGLTAEDRLSSHAPFHFDLSIFDLFAGLAAGATVALVPDERLIFPYALAEWMAEERISVWYSVPSALTQLLLYADLESHDLSALRLVLFAGEVFPAPHLRGLQGVLPTPGYYNLYGPTETNVCSVYAVPRLAPEQQTPCPIGRACANSRLIALDEGGAPVQPGGVGELYVEGPTLMAGYWGKPEASAAALVLHPLHPEQGGRVYRTGDFVRLEADGNYSFVGRGDGLVKSRGYRIELGEIEAALHSHPAVAEAAVVPLPDEEIGNRLLAFVVTLPDQTIGPGEVLAYCRAVLPCYMLPERVEVRVELPKTSTGKIDRRALIDWQTG